MSTCQRAAGDGGEALPAVRVQQTDPDSSLSPDPRLEMYRRVHNLRILACGGDGTVSAPAPPQPRPLPGLASQL